MGISVNNDKTLPKSSKGLFGFVCAMMDFDGKNDGNEKEKYSTEDGRN